MQPHLIAVLAEQRRLSCPCGARTARPGSLCRKCRHTALWLRRTRHAKRAERTACRLAARNAQHTPALLALVMFIRGGRP